jgi:hypothetical protein
MSPVGLRRHFGEITDSALAVKLRICRLQIAIPYPYFGDRSIDIGKFRLIDALQDVGTSISASCGWLEASRKVYVALCK